MNGCLCYRRLSPPVALVLVAAVVVTVMQTLLLGLIVTTNQRIYFCSESLTVATRKAVSQTREQQMDEERHEAAEAVCFRQKGEIPASDPHLRLCNICDVEPS